MMLPQFPDSRQAQIWYRIFYYGKNRNKVNNNSSFWMRGQNLSKTVSQDLARLSLINSLKQKIRAMKQQVQQQKISIETYKRSAKVTLINEQEIEIQKLNDQNKRLLLIIEDMKGQGLGPKNNLRDGRRKANKRNSLAKKKDPVEERHMYEEFQKGGKKQKDKKTIDFQSKYYESLIENDKIRKQLLLLKANQSLLRHKKPMNDRSNIMIEKSINEIDKVRQKNYELEVQLSASSDKCGQLKQRVCQLEQLLEKALQIGKSMKVI